MSRACEACGAREEDAGLRVWRWTCRSCDGPHDVCDPCVGRLGLRSEEEVLGVSPYVHTCPDSALLNEELMGGPDPAVMAAYVAMDHLKHEEVSDEVAQRVVGSLRRRGLEVKAWSTAGRGLKLVLEDGTQLSVAP